MRVTEEKRFVIERKRYYNDSTPIDSRLLHEISQSPTSTRPKKWIDSQSIRGAHHCETRNTKKTVDWSRSKLYLKSVQNNMLNIEDRKNSDEQLCDKWTNWKDAPSVPGYIVAIYLRETETLEQLDTICSNGLPRKHTQFNGLQAVLSITL